MSNSMSRYKRKRVKEEMAKKRAEKTVGEMKEAFVNMTDEQVEELAEAILEIENEESEEKE